MVRAFRLTACVAMMGVVIGQVQAAVTTFNDEATFLTATGPLSLESFEGLAATSGYETSAYALPGFTVTELSSDAELGIWNVSEFGGFATDGINWLGYQSSENEVLRFTLNSPANAFGLNVTDFGDFGSGSLTFSNSAGDSQTVAVSPRLNGNQLFFGILNTDFAFTQVHLTNTIWGEFYGVDEVYYGTPSSSAPEPASLALFGIGAIGLAFGARRRRRQR